MPLDIGFQHPLTHPSTPTVQINITLLRRHSCFSISELRSTQKWVWHDLQMMTLSPMSLKKLEQSRVNFPRILSSHLSTISVRPHIVNTFCLPATIHQHCMPLNKVNSSVQIFAPTPPHVPYQKVASNPSPVSSSIRFLFLTLY